MPIGDPNRTAELCAFVAELKDFALILDSKNHVRYANRAFCEAVGCTEAELMDGDFLGWVSAAERRHVQSELALASQGKNPAFIELTFIARDGREIGAEGYLTIHGLPDQPLHVHACLRDVTLRRREDLQTRVLSLIADRTDNCVVVTDVAGLTIWVNEGFTRKTGYSLDDMRGRKPGSVLQGPGTDPAVVRRIREKLARREGFTEEILNYRRDGTPYVSGIEIRPLFDRHGKLTNFMSVQRDLTEIRRVEAELREHTAMLERRVAERTTELERSRRQFEGLIEFAPDAFVITDMAGVIRVVNRQAEQMFGWPRAGMIGKELGMLIPERYRVPHSSLLKDFVRQTKERSSSHRPSVVGLRRDGTEFPAEISLGTLDSPDGKLVAGVIRDITERQKAEAALVASERTLKQAQQLALLGSWELELETNRLSWSDEIFRIFEIDREHSGASYQEFLDRVHPEDRDLVDRTHRDSLEKRTAYEVTHRLLLPDGRIKYVQERGSTESDASGKPVRTLGTVQDVTERVRSQQQIESSKQRLLRILGVVPIPLLHIDSSGGIAFRNERFVRVFGDFGEAVRTLEQWWEKAFPELEYRSGISARWKAAVDESRRKGDTIKPITCKVACQDGDVRTIEISGVSIGDEFLAAFVDLTPRVRAEENLRKFRTTADRATYGVAISSADGIREYVNEGWAQMHGWTVPALLGQHVSIFHSPGQLSRFRELYDEMMRFGSFTGEEVWHCRRDGSEFPTLMNTVVIPGATGEPEYAAATCLDITERVQNQRRLNLQNDILKALAADRPLDDVLGLLCSQVETIRENAICSVMQLGEDGRLRMVAGPRVLPELRTVLDGVSPCTGNVSCSTPAALRVPVFVCDTFVDPRWAGFLPVVEATGIRACWSIPIHAEGRAFGTFVILHTVPRSPNEHDERLLEECARLAAIAVERNRVRQALAESEAHFRTLADTGTALIWTSGTDGKCDYFNQTWLRFTGRPMEQELGDGWLDSVHEEDMESTMKGYLEAFGRRDTFTLIYRMRRHDGEYRTIEDYGKPRFNSRGEFAGYIGHCLDITDRLTAERQVHRSQRLEAIGQLAGGVAHDLNNALAPILMTSSVLRMEYPESSELIDTMEASAKRCSDMVRQLLTFARGAEGERLLLQPMQLFREMQRIIRGTFPKNIELRILPTPNVRMILGDATQLHQVLLNLCVNARDAMPNGGRLTLRAENFDVDPTFASTAPEAQVGSYVLLEVGDTGMGIPAEIQDRIFEPFFTTKPPDKGTGLGLSTVVGLVRGHGGFVQVSSSPGAGSRFQVFVPAAEKSDDSALCRPPGAETRLSGKGITVLVVDDELSVRNAFTTVLGSLDFNVLLASDGTDALITAAEKRSEIHVVITDLQMPQMGGMHLVRTLQRLLPQVPVIVASGRIESRDEQELISLGVTVQLSKPFTQETLVGALRQALAQRSGKPGVT